VACADARSAADDADAVILMLPDGPDVERVLFGEGGVAESANRGLLVIDMSTIAPATSVEAARRLAEVGIRYVDAPVSGGQPAAESGQLSIMLGGDHSDVAEVSSLVEPLSARRVHVGAVGAGQMAKACNQLIVGSTILAVAEAFALADSAGLDLATLREVLLGGFASSRVLEVHGQRIIDANFTPGFRSRLHLKDARIVESEAARSSIPLNGFAPVLHQLQSLVDHDMGDLDHSALYLTTGPSA
jgi:2-hydroxy-3-oxopropionate reductase